MTLKREWFDKIANKKKKIEYREIKPYWTKRLFDKDGELTKYDYIRFRNGYKKDSPIMEIKYLGLDIYPTLFMGKECYAIHLGKIFKIENYTHTKANTKHT